MANRTLALKDLLFVDRLFICQVVNLLKLSIITLFLNYIIFFCHLAPKTINVKIQFGPNRECKVLLL